MYSNFLRVLREVVKPKLWVFEWVYRFNILVKKLILCRVSGSTDITFSGCFVMIAVNGNIAHCYNPQWGMMLWKFYLAVRTTPDNSLSLCVCVCVLLLRNIARGQGSDNAAIPIFSKPHCWPEEATSWRQKEQNHCPAEPLQRRNHCFLIGSTDLDVTLTLSL